MATFRFVLSFDPALDRSTMDVREYARSGRDPALVKVLPGKRPVWYVADDLNVDAWLNADSKPSIQMKAYTAIMWGLKKIELSETESLVPRQEIEATGGKLGAIWDAAQIDELHYRFGPLRMYEIGTFIYERAYLGNVERGSASFALPHSSLHELEQIERRFAELTQGESLTQT